MKLVGIMGLEIYREDIRRLFEGGKIEVYSEMDITGHTRKSIEKFGLWHQEKDVPAYSTLFFAIVDQAKVKVLLDAVEQWPEDEFNHVPRAFVIDVEKMI